MDPIVEFCAIVLTFPYLWILFILSSLVCLPFFGIRWVIGQVASFLHPNWAGMLSGGDILFAEDPSSSNPKPHSILIGYTAVQGGLTLGELQEKYLQEVILSWNPRGGLNYPKFQQYFEKWCGYSFWKWEASFTIGDHIRLLSDEMEHEYLLTEDDLLTLLGPLGNKPFKKDFSPWEYLYVPSYLPKNGVSPVGLVVMRIHHSLGDGYSILKSFISYACGVPDKDALIVSSRPKGPRSHMSSGKRLWQFFHLGFQLMKIPYDFGRQMVTIDGSPWFLPKVKLSRVSHLGLTSKLPVKLIKELSDQRSVSFSAILYSAVGGGVRRFFLSRTERIPSEIQCFTPFPRPAHPDNQLVNHFTTAVVKLFPGESCGEERLRKNEVDVEGVKCSTFPLVMHFMMTILAAYPTWYVQLVGANWFASAILSNFPGPRDLVSYFRKYPVTDIVFWTPHLNGSSGIGISMLTYGDALRFALNVDSAILTNQTEVDKLCSCIEEELLSFFQSTNKLDENQNQNKILGKSEPSSAAELRLRSVS